MWFHRRFDDWQNALAEGETVPDETPQWWKYTVLCCWYLPLAAAFAWAGIGWWRNIDEPIALTIGLLFIGALLLFTLRGAYRVFVPKQPASYSGLNLNQDKAASRRQYTRYGKASQRCTGFC